MMESYKQQMNAINLLIADQQKRRRRRRQGHCWLTLVVSVGQP